MGQLDYINVSICRALVHFRKDSSGYYREKNILNNFFI
jgi:hypothetical protein